jgi:hypothetical protein
MSIKPFSVIKSPDEIPPHLRIGVKRSSNEEERERQSYMNPEAKKIHGYHSVRLEEKRQAALQMLGRWYKNHPDSEFILRGEYFLTIYHREIVRKRPSITITSGTVMLGIDLKKLVEEVIKNGDRVYVADLKILGSEQKEQKQ